MKLPELFRAYLLSSKALSRATAKNYASDIRKFIRWFEESFGKPFQSRDLSPDVITLFEKSRGAIIASDTRGTRDTIDTLSTASRSFERYFSSLRKFGAFLSEEEYIDEDPFDNLRSKIQDPRSKTDPWFLKDFKDYLYVYGASNLTIKNYVVDVNAFTGWLEDRLKIDLNVSQDYIAKITSEIVDEYKQKLIFVFKLSPKTVNRKLSSIRKYFEFAASQGHLSQTQNLKLKTQNLSLRTNEGLKLQDIEQKENGQWSVIPPIRLLQKLLIPYILLEDFIAKQIAQTIKYKKLSSKASIGESFKIKNIPARIPLHEKLIHHAKYTRPNWYKTYHSYAFTHYFHLALLVIYASAVGFILYNSLFAEPQERSALAGPIAPLRVLSFQGRLTDTNDNPITTSTDIRFGIYESQTATGSALLWQEVHSAVTPDSDGIFSILIGTKNGIQGSVFRDHDLLWLGITIGKTPELTPRQRLAAVAYAANSESLQGMLPITDSAASTANVVLALDSSGNLTMGGTAAPTFAATGGRFKLSGTTLLLSTQSSSNGDIDISPDGTGKIDVHKPIINDTATGNLIAGSVEINDKVAILATESAVAAFVINNNTSGGDIIAASSSGTTRLTLSNLGVLSLVGGQTADITSLSNANLTVSAGGSGDLRLLSDSDTDIILTNFTGNNSALYATASTGVLAGATTSTANLCLVSGASAPSWASCESGGTDAFWNQSSGLLFPNNATIDLSIGAQSTASAKFAFINVNSGTPTATISANSGNNATLLTGAGNLATTNMQSLTIGGSTTGNITIDSGSSSITLSDSTTLSSTLTLSANITQSNSGQYLCINTTSFEVGRNNTACSASSLRFKKNINDLSYGLSDVLKLRPVTFTFKPEMNMGSDLQVGFIAEEVEKVIPELVSYDNRGRPSGINYPNMTALLTRAVQELDLKNQELAAQVVSMGQSLRDYIIAVVSKAGFINNQSEIVSGLASIDRIYTNVISPLVKDSEIALDLHGSRFAVRSSSASDSAVVASIDNSGNATFSGTLNSNSIYTEEFTSERASISGQLAADSLTANNAAFSGTLYADKIQANSIEGLEDKIKSITSTTSITGITGTESANLARDTLDTLDTLGTFNIDFVDILNLSADFATFRGGLIALGPTTLTQATILDGLSIGTTLMIGPNSIDTLGQTFEIQPLRQGVISFMAGAVRIETDGTLKVTGNAEFAGNVKVVGGLSTDLISPLANKSLVISRSAKQTQEVASGSSNLRDILDIQGSASVSGALTSRKLNLSFAEQAFATSDIEAVATGSAGTAFLKQYRSEITIKNPNVTEKSLIYMTPVGNTNNKVLYLLRQTPENPNIEGFEGSFTVGVNSASTVTDIKFNWIIVN